MDHSAGNGQQPARARHGRPAGTDRGRPGARPGPADRASAAGGTPPGTCPRPGAGRAAVLGSLTLPGTPRQVAQARAFVARTLSGQPDVDSDAATLLTSELVTNAIQHTRSGDGGQVRVVVIDLPDGVLIEVTDQGSPGAPVVKTELYAAEGRGLFLVQQLAARWGYLRDPEGTTVWFHLATGGEAGAGTVNGPGAPEVARPPRQRLRHALS